jgi:PAS domain-containing protein
MSGRQQKKHGRKAEQIWKTGWTYIRTVIDTAREPFLILDQDLRVVAGNSCFFRTFQVSEKETEGILVYDLGNGQWNIPRLRKLLEDIVPQNTFFRDFEVDHEFPQLGRKIIILNARRIYKEEEEDKKNTLILLAMEDVTDHRLVAEKLAAYSQRIEERIGSELTELKKILKERDAELTELKKEIQELKKKLPSN